MNYLLDTNVVSDIRRRTPNANVTAWFETVSSSDLHLSVLTIGELRRGIELLRWRDVDQAEGLDRWLEGLRTIYKDRIVGVDSNIAEEWGRLNVPDPMPVIDGLLAATAKVHNWTLVTRNTADMARDGLRLLNPFRPSI